MDNLMSEEYVLSIPLQFPHIIRYARGRTLDNNNQSRFYILTKFSHSSSVVKAAWPGNCEEEKKLYIQGIAHIFPKASLTSNQKTHIFTKHGFSVTAFSPCNNVFPQEFFVHIGTYIKDLSWGVTFPFGKMCSYITLRLRISQAASNTFVLWCLSAPLALVKETGNASKLASTFQDCCKKDWCAVAVRTWGHVPVAITPDVLQTVISETRNGLLPLAIL